MNTLERKEVIARRKRAKREIEMESDLAHDVAASGGQIFDNVKHMKWFLLAVESELP